MMDRIFEFLFKYRPLVFEQGDFTFAAPGTVRLWLIAAGVVGAAAVASYTIARAKSTVVDRGIMAGLRVTLLALLVFCLMQPALILSTVVPQLRGPATLVGCWLPLRLGELKRRSLDEPQRCVHPKRHRRS